MAQKQPTISFLWNSKQQDHARTVTNQLKTAKLFDCVVAFAKTSGFQPIRSSLIEGLKVGMKARFIIGLDFCQSEPKLLSELLELKRDFSVKVYVNKVGYHTTFHPKIYRFDDGSDISLIVGSANLTGGGLSGNHEVSAMLNTTKEEWLPTYIDGLIKRKKIVSLTPKLLNEYKERYDVSKILESLTKKRIAASLKSPNSRIVALKDILDDMRRGGSQSEFVTRNKIRIKHRSKAKKIAAQIEKLPSLSPQKFLSFYGELAGNLWHSGGLQRGKTRIAKNSSLFQAIVRQASTYTQHSVANIYDKLRSLATNVGGIGPNLLTEILHTYDNKQFAVMNQNSVAGLRLAGFSNFPEKPNRYNVNGKSYSEFCTRAKSVQNSLKLKDLSELDCLFNYAYWERD
jgi:HKD family nuclease